VSVDAEALSHCSSLESLTFVLTAVVNVSALADLPRLRELNLYAADGVDQSALVALPHLRRLSLAARPTWISPRWRACRTSRSSVSTPSRAET